MTAAQKRVAIAKDVIKQIKVRKLIISTGQFCDIYDDGCPYRLGKKELLRKMPVCHVCAIGAAIVSGIRLFNQLEIVDRDIDGNSQEDMIKKFFSPKQAALIEQAFELGNGWYDDTFSYKDKGRYTAVAFGEKFKDSKDRAVAIFKNIIKNKGVFIP